ncbi:hypothetical protein SAMN05444156_1189 [Verrucomicrobium sp. GAS474]|nr:hypothetical protein SAMN05444156_1189 [Verrucomicrobium sp. GAS474]
MAKKRRLPYRASMKTFLKRVLLLALVGFPFVALATPARADVGVGIRFGSGHHHHHHHRHYRH